MYSTVSLVNFITNAELKYCTLSGMFIHYLGWNAPLLKETIWLNIKANCLKSDLAIWNMEALNHNNCSFNYNLYNKRPFSKGTGATNKINVG